MKRMKRMKNIIKLNKEQVNAINTINGNLLIIASAGTGKTTTIVERYVNLIKNQGYSQNEVMMTTFTNKAAKDMIDKISRRTDKLLVWIGTMHALFLRILRENAGLILKNSNFTLITDDSEKKKIIKGIAKKERIKANANEINYITKIISIFKGLGIFSENLAYDKDLNSVEEIKKHEELFEDEIVYISSEIENKRVLFYKKYQDFLKNSNLLDFDDILLYTFELFEKYPDIKERYSKIFKAIMVDEAQDLNVVQIRILNHLVDNNICLIGDDCQNIYEWRGSSNELVFQFEKKHKKIILEDNYRSTGNILNAVNKAINSMKFKISKKLICTKEKGDRIIIQGFEDIEEEIDYIIENVKNIKQKEQLHEIAILTRTNHIGKDIEREFIRNRIPYHLSKSKGFFEREETKDILSYLNLLVNPNSSVDFERLIKILPGVGNVSISKIHEYATKNNLNYIEILEKIEVINLNDQVKYSLGIILDSINESGNPIEILLKNINYLKILENKYRNEELKLEDKFENIKLVLDLYKGYSHDVKGIKDFLDSLIEIEKKEKDNNKVKISTIHSAKGLEWKYVFLACCNEKILPYYKDKITNIKRDSELRLFYVAISRAKEHLYITHSFRHKWQSLEPSQFLEVIE
jgi:DNA helicase-2/ATP-dependent DNA helicase PcrA